MVNRAWFGLFHYPSFLPWHCSMRTTRVKLESKEIYYHVIDYGQIDGISNLHAACLLM